MVSLWLTGAIPGRSIVPYVGDQMAWRVLGGVRFPSIGYAAIVPAPCCSPRPSFSQRLAE